MQLHDSKNGKTNQNCDEPHHSDNETDLVNWDAGFPWIRYCPITFWKQKNKIFESLQLVFAECVRLSDLPILYWHLRSGICINEISLVFISSLFFKGTACVKSISVIYTQTYRIKPFVYRKSTTKPTTVVSGWSWLIWFKTLKIQCQIDFFFFLSFHVYCTCK